MNRQKSRKGHENRRFTCDGVDFSVNGRDQSCHEKIKHKRHVHSDKKRNDMSPNSYQMNWPPQPRMHSFAHRQFSASDSSFCHYSVPLSLSFEPFSLPIYPTLIQPQGNCAVPLEIEPLSTQSKHHKTQNKKRQIKANSIDQNVVPAIFETPRIHNGDQQDYTSLPPVNCDIYATKSSDVEAACRRRFSDPGIGQISSDDCSSTRSEEGSQYSSGTAEFQNQNIFGLVEQVNELKENNSHLKKELLETKLEIESLKMNSHSHWKTGCEDLKPGALSDAILEIRNAVKLGEETLISKVTQMLEKTAVEQKEALNKLEERLRQEMNERLANLEKQISNSSVRNQSAELPAPDTSETTSKDPAMQQQLLELEQEKFQLRKELQEAVAKRKVAEATTEKLERLVGILRKKINGVSLETCIPDEKHNLVRPLASSLEKNPFIIANNRQGQKSDTLPMTKTKIPPFRPFSFENNEGTNSVQNENKENETRQSASLSGNGSSGSVHNSPTTEQPSLTAQVTITGPVTDL